jgi:hypothetical protein
MATAADTARLELARSGVKDRPAGGLRFDRAAVGLYAWMVVGFYLDAWAHNHNAGIETFFTPWHAVLYSGFAVIAFFFVATAAMNRTRGYAWQALMPVGYELTLLGVAIFSLGGPLDLLWHEIFGIEVNIEAALSPTHLFLALGAVLVLSGPLRAAWHRRGQASDWTALGPAMLSLIFTLSVFTLLTQWAHPFVSAGAGPDTAGSPYRQMLGITSIVLQSGLLMGFVLLAVRRWTLPFGAVTLVFTISTVLISFMRDQYRFIPMAIVAGLVADVLIMELKPSAARPGALRLFAFAVPAVLIGLYFLAVARSEGIGWAIELWTGSIVFAGVTGLLLSVMVAPPRVPGEEEAGG